MVLTSCCCLQCPLPGTVANGANEAFNLLLRDVILMNPFTGRQTWLGNLEGAEYTWAFLNAGT